MCVLRCILLFCLIAGVFIPGRAQDEVLLPVKVDRQWGYINPRGELKIEPQFETASEFNGKKMARATLHGKLVLINRKGEVYAQPDLKSVIVLNDSLYAGSPDNLNWGLYQVPFKTLITPRFTDVKESSDPYYFLVMEGALAGLADVNGKVIIKPNFSLIAIYTNYFYTQFDGKCGAYNKAGKEILSPVCNNIFQTNYEYLFFEVNARWGCIAFNGDTLLMPEHTKLEGLSGRFVKATDRRERVYNLKTRKSIFDDFKGTISRFTDSLLYLRADTMLGVGNENGEIVLQPMVERISILGDNYFVRRDNRSGIYSGYTKVIVPVRYDMITIPDTGLYLGKNINTEALYSNTGKLLIAEGRYTISAGDGRIKVKHADKIEVYKLGPGFAVVKDDEFMNVVTVSIRKRVAVRDAVTPIAVPPPPVVVSGGWFRNDKGKCGKVNGNGDTIVKPIFDSYREFPEKDLALVYVYQESAIRLEVSGHRFSYNNKVGLVQNSTGKVFARPEFCYIDVGSIKDSNFVSTRAMHSQGQFCFIVKGRRPVFKKITYVDTASTGLMRFCEEGRLTTMPNPGSKATYLCTYLQFLSSIGITFTSDMDGVVSKTKVYIEGGKWGFWSTRGYAKIMPQYQYASPMYGDRAIVKHGNHYGIIDAQNKTILPYEYYFIELLENAPSHFKVWQENSNFGYITQTGQSLVTPVYTKLLPFSEGYCVGVNNGRSRFIDSTGDFFTDTAYQRANNFLSGVAAVKHNNLWGFIDKRGAWVIYPQYNGAGSFSNGLAPVRIRNYWGYVNMDGKPVVRFKYVKAGNFVDGLAVVKNIWGRYGYINTQGRYAIFPTYVSATDFDAYGLARVRRLLGTSSYIHQNGMKANLFRFYKSTGFSEGMNVLSRINKYAIMDTTGKIVHRFNRVTHISPYKNGYAVIVRKRKYGIIDKEGNYVIKPSYKYLSDVNEKGYMVYSNGRKRGVINFRGRLILEARHAIIGGCDHNVLLMHDAKGYFYTDIKGVPISDTRYEMAKPFIDGVAKVYVNNNWALMNDKGILITNPKYRSIRKMNASLYKVEVAYFYGIVDDQGNFVVEPNYDFVAFTADKVFRVENGDKVGYISKEGKWIWRTRN